MIKNTVMNMTTETSKDLSPKSTDLPPLDPSDPLATPSQLNMDLLMQGPQSLGRDLPRVTEHQTHEVDYLRNMVFRMLEAKSHLLVAYQLNTVSPILVVLLQLSMESLTLVVVHLSNMVPLQLEGVDYLRNTEYLLQAGAVCHKNMVPQLLVGADCPKNTASPL